MKYLVTGKEMKYLDQNTILKYQTDSIILMEQAAFQFVTVLTANYTKLKNVLVVCGFGNNGGDGLAIARLLNQKNINTSVYLCSDVWQLEEKESDEYKKQAAIYKSYGYPMVDTIKDTDTYDCIIDAVFGVGLSRKIEEPFETLFRILNQMKGLKIAVDIASGISSDNGEVLGCAFKADKTYSFAFGKVGMYLWPGCDYSGEVEVLPIGITSDSWMSRKPKLAYIEKEDLFCLPARKAHSNKGTYGKLLLIAGSHNMAGASVLAAKAAYRAGTGLVKVYTPEVNRLIIQTAVPEAVLVTYREDSLSQENLIAQLKWADAVVIGPGIGLSNYSKAMLECVLANATVPVVIDADALTILSDHTDILLRPHMDLVLTPHLGEMAKLIKASVAQIQSNLVATAVEFANNYDVICVLKDFRTITAIPYGLAYLNFSGNNGMATAGSGDVLAGMIGSFLAQGMKSEIASSFGVYLHGLAGDAIVSETGYHGLMASDLIDGLKIIWNQVENNVKE